MNNPDINETLDAGMRDFALRMGDRQQQRNNAVAAATPPYQAPTRSMVEQRESTLLPPPVDSATVPPQETTSDGVLTTGAFYGLYEDSSGDTYLQGGTATGGDGTETIADIKVIDNSTGPIASTGDHLYLECTGDGVTEDDVLLPGWDLSSVASAATASTVPSNTLPTAAGATGKKVYVDLGVFTDDSFLPSNIGNIGISFCPGSYTVART